MHKKFESPKHPWDEVRIGRESRIRKNFGLKSKKEIWKAETMLRGFRREARRLEAKRGEATEREISELIQKLISLKLVKKGADLDAVLTLELDDILGRRLQSVVYQKGLARTANEARQFIKHGHITVGGRRITVPSYMVREEEEDLIGHAENSTIAELFEAGPTEEEAEGEA